MPTKKLLQEHARLIDLLGGTYAVRDRIEAETGHKVTSQAITNWKTKHGISWRFRTLLAKWAVDGGHKTPKDFLGPEV